MARVLVALLWVAPLVAVANTIPTCRAGFQSVAEVSACLEAIPVSATMRGAVRQALLTLQELYAYSDLMMNSADNDAHFSSEWMNNGCERFPVHESNLQPLNDQLAAMWESETSLGRLWRAIGRFSVELRDAHSHVDPPWSTGGTNQPGGVLSVPPFDFVVEQNSVVKLGCNWYANLYGSVMARNVTRLSLSAQGIQDLVRCDDYAIAYLNHRTFDPNDSRDPKVGKTIQTVNGMPALDYLRSVADLMGSRRGLSNRLNDYLDGVQSGPIEGVRYVGQALMQPKSIAFPPGDGRLHVVFDDGTEFETAWTTYLGSFKDQTVESLELDVSRLQAHYERSSLLSFVDVALNDTSRPDLLGCGTPMATQATGIQIEPLPPSGAPTTYKPTAEATWSHPATGRPKAPYETTPAIDVSFPPIPTEALGGPGDAACPAYDPATEPGPFTLFKQKASGQYLDLANNCTWDLPSDQYLPAFPRGLSQRCHAKFPGHAVTWWYSPVSDLDTTPLTGATSIILLEPDDTTVPPTVTFKIESYTSRSDPTSTNGMQPEAVFPQMRKAVALAHQYAKDKLLIDLTGNGGGTPNIASMMLEYFFGGDGPLFTPLGAECQWLSQPLPKLSMDWLRLYWNVAPTAYAFGGAVDAALKSGVSPIVYLNNTGTPAQTTQKLIADLVAPWNRLDAIFKQGGFEHGLVTYLAMATADPTKAEKTMQDICQDDDPIVFTGWITQLKTYILQLTKLALVGQCLESGQSYLGQTGSFQFAPDFTSFAAFDPASAAPGCGLAQQIEPAISTYSGFIMPSQGYPTRDVTMPATTAHYRQFTPKSYGGIERDYAALFTHMGACPAPVGADQPDYYAPTILDQPPAAQTSLKHVTIISDGACGSSCAVFALPAYLSGKATVVTYGGFRGEPMDITSFNGGPVKDWPEIWQGLQSATLFLNAFVPASPGAGTTFGPVDASRFAPMAGPTNARFIMSGGVAAQTLGPESLPVEWYKISGSYHLDFHTQGPGQLDSTTLAQGMAYNWCQLFSLYNSVDAMPAAPLTCTPRPTLSFSMFSAAAASSLGGPQQNAIKATLVSEMAKLPNGVKLQASDIALVIAPANIVDSGRRLGDQMSSAITVTLTVPPKSDETKLADSIRSATTEIKKALVDAGIPITDVQGPLPTIPDDDADWFSEVGNAAFMIGIFALTLSLASVIALAIMASKSKAPAASAGSIATPSAVTYSTEHAS